MKLRSGKETIKRACFNTHRHQNVDPYLTSCYIRTWYLAYHKYTGAYIHAHIYITDIDKIININTN